ncbi:hypothetical protein ACFPM0_02825 [Pseudonocardia sulfidoxydans]
MGRRTPPGRRRPGVTRGGVVEPSATLAPFIAWLSASAVTDR